MAVAKDRPNLSIVERSGARICNPRRNDDTLAIGDDAGIDVADGHAVRVGGDHPQAVCLGGHQHTGEDLSLLVGARGLDHLAQGVAPAVLAQLVELQSLAAAAALASVKQGKHLELHNALMEFGGKLDRDRILEIAGKVGLDVAQLQKDMEDAKIKEIIGRNAALASALGVRGTPAFVIGDQFVPGAVDTETLKQLVSAARKS